MNRRAFLQSVAGTAFAAVLPCRSESAPANPATTIDECSTDGRVCRAGISLSTALMAYASQQMSVWCWAASIEMIFRAHGYYVPQQEIVQAVYGRVVNLPAFSGYTISTQLNRSWTDTRGRNFTVRIDGLYDHDAHIFGLSNSAVVNALQAGNPLIYGNVSHAMMLGIVDYYPVSPEPQFRAAGFADPWPGIGLRGLSDPLEIVAMDVGGKLRYLAVPIVTPN